MLVRAVDMMKVREWWNFYNLPEDMTGISFLDVGCWAGGYVKEAMNRGSDNALGIDIVKSPHMVEGIEFLQMDIFSEKFLELPRFDLVFCAGVLYHVENPISLLVRLRLKTASSLFLETEISTVLGFPFLQFCPGDSYKENASNWWIPNISCVEEMLEHCGFDIDSLDHNLDKKRAWFHCIPIEDGRMPEKILPRKRDLMDS